MLGPLEVFLDRGPAPLGGRKQRTLLAVLLLHANEAVSRDQLIDALWRELPPASAAESLDTYVYRLRKLLGHDRLVREGGGYRLRVDPGELDIAEFERLVAHAGDLAAAGDHRAALTSLSEALDLWRGRAWGDALDEPSVEADARRLEELRLSARESRIEAQLALGGGAQLVPELEQLVSEYPLRERLVAALMLALYRAGRQADALDAFRVARGRLVEELGLEPAPEIYELQRRVLQHDPSLAGPRRFPHVAGSGGRRTFTAAALLALVAVLVGGIALRTSAAGRRPSLAAGVSGVVAISAQSNRIVAVTPLAGTPAAITEGVDSIWVADASNGGVSRIDPVSGDEVDRIPVGGDPASIARGDGAVWVASAVGAAVLRIDPTTETVTQRIPLAGDNPDALAFGSGRLWVADSSTRALYVFDGATGRLQRTIPLGISPSAVVFGAGAVWVAGYDSGTVIEVDAAKERIRGGVHVGTGPVSLAVADGEVWAANSLDSTVSEIDPISLTVRATIPVGSGPDAVLASAGSVWVANQYSGSVSRIDPRRDAVVTTTAVGGMPVSLTSDGDRLWVGVAAGSRRHRGGTLVVASTGLAASVDPAFFNRSEPTTFDGLAYDTLVTFDHTAGVDGLRLVPDLAQTLPTPTDAGRTYVFHLRPGIRYSNGTLVKAGDFRRAIERLFRLGSPGSGYYTDIVGAAGCVQRSSDCHLGRGIVTDDATGTVVFHLVAPDPEFLYELTEQDYTAPVPPSTPDRDTGLNPIPGTGPYRIAQVNATSARFVRNPYFREWSHAAQPDGNPNVIVWHFRPTQQAAAAAVEAGRADWLNGGVPSPEYRRIAIQSPAQLHSHPLFGIDFLPLNTHLAPFNHIAVRRALNYAIDRTRVARMYGGPTFATPACQPLAPGLPGYRRYCPYTSHPSRDGAYAGPDLAYARRLVANSGTRGEHVDVWGSPDEGYVPPGMPRYVASVLRKLGYRATARLRPIASITAAMSRRFQISTNGDWLSDYPDPSSYLPAFFSCGGGNSNGDVCDRALDRQMHRAELLEHAAPDAANAVWRSVDRTLTDQGDWVPTVSVREVDFVSKRLGNYQFNPVWGFLVDQSWIR